MPPSIWVWYLVSRSLGCSACVWAFGRIGSVSRMRVSRLEVVSRRPFILILHSPARIGACGRGRLARLAARRVGREQHLKSEREREARVR